MTKQLQELGEYATEFTHRRPSLICGWISGKKSFYHNIIRGPFLFQNVIWTKVSIPISISIDEIIDEDCTMGTVIRLLAGTAV
jgi:hypothetical protein